MFQLYFAFRNKSKDGDQDARLTGNGLEIFYGHGAGALSSCLYFGNKDSKHYISNFKLDLTVFI